MNFERDIKIDETSLDTEWLGQAELAIRYGKYWVECKERFTRAEENVKIITSELILEVNQTPSLVEGKPTVANIEAYYRTHPRHIEAKEEWVTAMTELNTAEIVKNEICFTRKAALEALVQLHGQQYFAGPKVPRDISREWEDSEKGKRANAVVSTAMRRNKL